ncbi:MAG: hypothetical protein EBT15_09615 [Betaproteobacteria bacterium]|nr:hypothetical protein [Betaproteobacteria bacterium]
MVWLESSWADPSDSHRPRAPASVTHLPVLVSAVRQGGRESQDTRSVEDASMRERLRLAFDSSKSSGCWASQFSASRNVRHERSALDRLLTNAKMALV